MKSGVLMRSLVASLGLLLGASQLSCSVNDYCLNCGHLDGGGSGSDDANDGGGSGTDAAIDAACVPTGPESCDGKDNDCNGLIDDGTLPGVDDLCPNQMGACAGGRMICDSGALKCDPAKSPKPESCNNIDDNCNGPVDEGDPGGGAKCGTEAGTCVAGTERCTNGSVQCIGFQDHTSDPETCNGQDDDCDTNIDEGIGSLGSCGPVAKNGIGICVAGNLMCMGGVPTCTGAVFPAFETCNHLDDDCSGAFAGDTSGVDDTFNTQTDPNNCGDCFGLGGAKCNAASKTCIYNTNDLTTDGTTCTDVSMCSGTGPKKACVANSSPKCTTGTCSVSCNAGFVNLNGSLTDGCEYHCTKTSNVDDCDGIDNDCDGTIDEDKVAPVGLCKAGGACGTPGPTATCTGASGWVCNYTNMTCQGGTAGANTGAVCASSATCTNGGSCILAPTEFPEQSCDGIDNNCDGNIDESHQPDSAGNVKGTACDDGEPGVCLDTGTWSCDTTSAVTKKGNLVCTYSTNNPDLPRTGIEEDCNSKDDDCDGKVDEQLKTFHTCSGGTNDGTVCTTNATCTGGGTCKTHGQDWVDIGGGKSMMQFEVSRPDAATDNILETIACSRQNVQPWTNVAYPDAQAMCQALKFCTAGTNAGVSCSVAGDCPGGACAAAHLCSEEDWHHTCAAVAFPTSATTSVNNAGSFIEAEDFTSSTTGSIATTAESGTQCAAGNAVDDDGDGVINDGCPASGTAESGANCTDSNDNDTDTFINDGCPANGAKIRSWTEDYLSIPGNATTFGTWTGIGDMQATANTGASMLTGAQAAAQGPSMSYSLSFTATGTYHVWLRMYAPSTKDDMVYVGMSSPPADAAKATASSTTQWAWVDTAVTFVISGTVPQAKTLTIWMGDDGARVDRIFVGTSASAPTDAAVSHGNTWAFSSPANPNVYGADVCNGDDHDTNGAVAGDQDDILGAGTLSATTCAATQNSNLVYDMSGNVKEWVLAHASGENPIRGGASNSSAAGLSCALNFTLADDAFVLPNIGFRCCR